jgi:putative inorganic carbon (HCO3(-)) transporter
LTLRYNAAMDSVTPHSGEVQPGTETESEEASPQYQTKISYAGLLLFALGYFGRPEDWLGHYIGLALIGGITALVGFVIYLAGGGPMTRKREAKILIALLVWMVLTIPFAEWPGGAFQELKESIWKVFLLSIVMMHVLVDLSRIRRLIILQVIAVTGMAWYAHSHFDKTGRAIGMGPQFGNSNDLSVLISVVVPFVIYLLITSKNYVLKLLYIAAMGTLLYALVLTYSRTGFIALMVAAIVCAYQIGWKRGRKLLVVVGGVLGLATLLLVGPSDYGKLVMSLVTGDEDVGSIRADAAASREGRSRLMMTSVTQTLKHPIFGVGPDGFQLVSGDWHVSHNTYLQFASEGGIPAFVFFLMLVKYTISNLNETERLTQNDRSSPVSLLNGALKASFYSLLAGAFFANYAYNFFPYFLIAYAAALNQLAPRPAIAVGTEDPDLQPAFQS